MKAILLNDEVTLLNFSPTFMENEGNCFYLAVAIEAVFVFITLGYYFKQEARMGIVRTMFNKASIIGMFVFGIGFMLSIATVSFRDWLGIPEFDIGSNTSVPVLIILYIAMIAHLNFYIPNYSFGEKGRG